MAMVEISKNDLLINPFTKLDKQWFLLTAGDIESYNTMTASWGALGTIWGKSAVTAYVRHSRKTFEFMESSKLFTVSFFGEEYRKALSFCGKYSGRDYDKAKETGLTPIELDGAVSFEQAELVLVCSKLYSQDFNLADMDKSCADTFYSGDSIHRAYIGEVLKLYRNI